jgi:hypothetical protein
MSTTKDAVESEYHLKLELEKSGRSVKGHIALVQPKFQETGEEIHVQRTQFRGDDGNVRYCKFRRRP